LVNRVLVTGGAGFIGSRASKLLGYKPKTSLREGLTMLLRELGVRRS